MQNLKLGFLQIPAFQFICTGNLHMPFQVCFVADMFKGCGAKEEQGVCINVIK
jgi:hypothetical protein